MSESSNYAPFRYRLKYCTHMYAIHAMIMVKSIPNTLKIVMVMSVCAVDS
jgi:hypothetical protein